MTYLPYFGYNKNFLQEDGSLHFLCVYWTLPLCKKLVSQTDERTDREEFIGYFGRAAGPKNSFYKEFIKEQALIWRITKKKEKYFQKLKT